MCGGYIFVYQTRWLPRNPSQGQLLVELDFSEFRAPWPSKPISYLRSTIYGSPPGHTDRGLAFPSQQPGLLAPDPRYPGFQSQSKFPIEKILPDFHPIPGYLDPRLICLAWPLGEPSPVSVRRFVFILPSFGVSQFTILFNTSITPNRLRYPSLYNHHTHMISSP